MEEKLLLATRKKLEKNGTLGHLRSEFEHEILNLLGLVNGLKKDQRQSITMKRNIADELVADYLDWIGYSFTSAIFSSESSIGSSNIKFERTGIIKELGLEEYANDSLPLLCLLVHKVHQCYKELAAILAWISKLEETTVCTKDKAIRNEYTRYLAHQLSRQTLQHPFTKEPPEGRLKPLIIPRTECQKSPSAPKPGIPCMREEIEETEDESLNYAKFSDWPFIASSPIVQSRKPCPEGVERRGTGTDWPTRGGKKPCKFPEPPSKKSPDGMPCHIPSKPLPIPDNYLKKLTEEDDKPFTPQPACSEENQFKLTKLAAGVCEKTELFEFMNDVAPYTCDLGESMQAVISEELAQFRDFVKSVYQTRMTDTQEILSKEHIKLKARYDEWESNILRKAQSALGALRLSLPSFNYEAYKKDPEYLYYMLRNQMTLESSDDNPQTRVLRTKAQKNTWLNEESQRIEKDNLDRMIETRELNAQLTALSNNYNAILQELSEKNKDLENKAAQLRFRHDNNQKQIDHLIDLLNTPPKDY